ncbi:hypothetical protein BP422_08340 [Brevibacillus formosus]|uniref:Uncharacterized protein n=1 Tax=Brevibacillus formosus TaxID=54913 RepID=A0A220MEW2_9BACL|nr:hypothetical protein BP422_08340 [Brevibacillus formosus]
MAAVYSILHMLSMGLLIRNRETMQTRQERMEQIYKLSGSLYRIKVPSATLRSLEQYDNEMRLSWNFSMRRELLKQAPYSFEETYCRKLTIESPLAGGFIIGT